MGEKWKASVDHLKRPGVITFRLSEVQQARFNDRFTRLLARAKQAGGPKINSFVVCLAINHSEEHGQEPAAPAGRVGCAGEG